MNNITKFRSKLRPVLKNLVFAIAIVANSLGALPASAQLAPTVNGFTFSFSNGRGGGNRTGVGTFSGVRVPTGQVITEPGNTELITRPDGSFAFRIIDPSRKFGSAVEFGSIESSTSRSSNFVINQINDFGYSVFQQ